MTDRIVLAHSVTKPGLFLKTLPIRFVAAPVMGLILFVLGLFSFVPMSLVLFFGTMKNKKSGEIVAPGLSDPVGYLVTIPIRAALALWATCLIVYGLFVRLPVSMLISDITADFD
jgi:hypothetical protein